MIGPRLDTLVQREEHFTRRLSWQKQGEERKLALQKHELKVAMEKRMNRVYEETASLVRQIPDIRESFKLQLQEKDRHIDVLRRQRDDLAAFCARQQERLERLEETKVSGRAFGF